MKYSRIGVIALSCVMLAGMRVAFAIELSATQSAAVGDAEAQGQALYDAAKATTTPTDGEVVRTAKGLIRDFCALEYRALVINNTTNEPQVYFLALPAKEGDVVFGRHYKVVGN